MQAIERFKIARIFTLLCLMIAPLVSADVKQIQLPPETARLPESDLAGYQLATQKCMICHSVDYIQFQPPGMNLAQWTSEVAKMKHSYGAVLNNAEIKSIGAYLAVVYGTAKATDSEIMAASMPGKPDADAELAMDVQILLDTNACMGCHALDGKLLGPSFKEVAIKYKSDKQAQSILARSIIKGGVGKWGHIPMPAMSSLTDQQAEAIAKFVLTQ